MATATEKRDRILKKAAVDGEFRARLIADPKAAISDEIGEPLPEGFEVVVHEDSATTFHLVLPPSPALAEAELQGVAGGQLPYGHPTPVRSLNRRPRRIPIGAPGGAAPPG